MVAAESLELLRSVCMAVRKRHAPDDSMSAPATSNSIEWNDSWLALQHLCPEALAGAADILDNKSLTRVVAKESRREFFVVDGNGRNKSHTCVPGFCTCMSYCLNVVSKPDALVCKHELAVLLADSLGLALTRELAEAEWSTQFTMATTMPLMAYDPATAASGHAHPDVQFLQH